MNAAERLAARTVCEQCGHAPAVCVRRPDEISRALVLCLVCYWAAADAGHPIEELRREVETLREGGQ